eukprot:7182494-Prorocentrum_lima.AAC.1
MPSKSPMRLPHCQMELHQMLSAIWQSKLPVVEKRRAIHWSIGMMLCRTPTSMAPEAFSNMGSNSGSDLSPGPSESA